MAELEGLVVLIADDEPMMRTVVEKALAVFPIRRSILAPDGRAALKALGSSPDALASEADHAEISDVGLIITDLTMPEANGLDILRAVRSGYTGVAWNIPVILMSGFIDAEVDEAARALDVDAVLQKPVSLKTLRSAVVKAAKERPCLVSTHAYRHVSLPHLH